MRTSSVYSITVAVSARKNEAHNSYIGSGDWMWAHGLRIRVSNARMPVYEKYN